MLPVVKISFHEVFDSFDLRNIEWFGFEDENCYLSISENEDGVLLSSF